MSTSIDHINDPNPDDHTISVTSLGEAEQVPAGRARDEQPPDDQFRSVEYRDEPSGDQVSEVGEPAHRTTSDDDAWLALQGKFVDDPAQAVQEAADRVERQLADVRSGLSSADTEGLRTAFRRYRELSDSLR